MTPAPDAGAPGVVAPGVVPLGVVPLDGGWQVGRCAPDAHATPPGADDLRWTPARVPGTAASALAAAGEWRPGEPLDPDASDWWFATAFPADPVAAGERVALRLDGVATVAEVFLNGERVAESASMFTAISVDVTDRLRERNELAIRCRALTPRLRPRRRPRARWRTRVASDGNLRWFRTTLLGRAPGFSPGPAPVGPWRPVRLVRGRSVAIKRIALRPRLDGDAGVLDVRATLAPGLGTVRGAELLVDGPSGAHRAALMLEDGGARVGGAAVGGAADPDAGAGPDGDGRPVAEDAPSVAVAGSVTIADVARWWPHTHGDPVLHRATLRLTTDAGAVDLPAGSVGFRTAAPGPAPAHDVLVDGLDLHVNGVRVFARGAVWTGADPVGLAPDDDALRRALEQVRDAGMNLLRIAGIGVYESVRFHELCDELGIMVWQDLAFANFDYPIADDAFRAAVTAEADELLERIGGRPSTVVVCGNSEVDQQVAMLGLDPDLARGALFDELLPERLATASVDATYVPSSPCGGTPPMRTDVGIAHYYGVGGYRRPLDDARRADVRFAAECLAFANVPDDEALAALLPGAPADLTVHHPRWKAGVPRDAGTGWDFDDVRDHYLRDLYGIDPGELRRTDHERYLELSRSVSGEVMAAVLGEWRRGGSRCGGGLVLWWRDVVPGAGWGLVDHAGAAKAALGHVRRALAPVAVWTTDEGLNGIAVHVANDRPSPLRCRLRVALYRDGEQLVADGAETLDLPPHATVERRVDALVGRFVDSAWAYRFGPAPHDVVVATLEADAAGDGAAARGGGADATAGDTADGGDAGRADVLSQAVAFPAGRPLERHAADALGLTAVLSADPDGTPTVTVRSRRFVHGVRIAVAGHVPEDDGFPLEPGGRRVVRLRAVDGADGDAARPGGATHERAADATAASGERRSASAPSGGTLRALNLRGTIRLRAVEPSTTPAASRNAPTTTRP